MSELNEFAKLIAEGKKQQQEKRQQSINEIGNFFSTVTKGKVESPTHKILSKVKENVTTDINQLFSELKTVVPYSAENQKQEKINQPSDNLVVTDQLKQNLEHQIQPVVEATVDQYLRNASFQQPNPEKTDPNIKAIQEKLKFLEQAIGKIAATGPGSGAAEVYNLDFPTKQVIGDYEIGRKDYYIGVNCNVKCCITLPIVGKNLKDGRIIVIKDESGHAQLTPIKIVGTVDNDPNGAEIRINNGAVQLIYRNGSWRVI